MQEKYDQQKIINENNLSQIKKRPDHTQCAHCLNHFVFHHSNNKLSIPTKNSFSKTRDIGERRKKKIRYFTMKIHENETLINRNKMRIEELTIQMEGSLEIKEQWKEQNKIRQEIQQQNENAENWRTITCKII